MAFQLSTGWPVAAPASQRAFLWCQLLGSQAAATTVPTSEARELGLCASPAQAGSCLRAAGRSCGQAVQGWRSAGAWLALGAHTPWQ